MKRFCCFLASALILLSSFSSFGVETPCDGECRFYIRRGKAHAPATTDPAFETMFEGRAYYRDARAGSTGEKRIYLTFDAGYENGNVEKILDVLKEEEVCGAFFILSHLIKSAPALVLRMGEEGHLVCNHTAHHKNTARLTKEAFASELSTLASDYTAISGRTLAGFYRPPEGTFSPQSLRWAEEMGYKTVFWSLAYCDWNDSVAPSRERAMQILKDNTHPGAIVLLHPTSRINVEILRDMISYWRTEGYTFASLDTIA